MFNLLRKEMIQGLSNIKHTLGLLVVLIILGKQLIPEGIYFYIILGIVYVLTNTADTMDEFKKGVYIINSLPVTRKEVVFSKYLSGTIICILVTAIFQIITYVGGPFGLPVLKFYPAFIIICFITFYNAISYLLYFCIPFRISNILRIIVYTITYGFCFGFLSKSSQKETLDMINGLGLNFNLIVLGILMLFAISMFVSLRVYENKDL
ncbi:hypothetical protein CLOACE_04800 [Clostridium acetireducens DSM 10703]|uniref:ABC-2 family transporter protein n=1 Tax=Clostridium acetireducens DSM 10703 TaxID=1121290 RepID=A0A1E8F0S7_9CLOT|nr:ABC-2 transporter permease [Clostridium acetireducens]OFI07075.1 hypothetical protein CLOACE_04800 [Clostridium acetireducens DSM 10703]